MASIEVLEKHKAFFDDLMTFLPENEGNFEVPEKPADAQQKGQGKRPNQKQNQKQQRTAPNQKGDKNQRGDRGQSVQQNFKPKAKPKGPAIRPGFEGAKVIKKKRAE